MARKGVAGVTSPLDLLDDLTAQQIGDAVYPTGRLTGRGPSGGVIAFPGVEIYVASKHAVIGLTKSAALEFGKQGIRVNAILPAVIETDMFERFGGEKPEFRAQVTALHPIGRIGKSEEIADAAIWLSSSKSSFVTGHSLLVDGGFTAQ